VLANCRQSLSIPDEHTYRVGSLGVSGAAQEPSGRPPAPTGPAGVGSATVSSRPRGLRRCYDRSGGTVDGWHVGGEVEGAEAFVDELD
jgi:hypothetical protein